MDQDKSENYRSYVISWIVPPLMSEKWTLNILSDKGLVFATLDRSSKVVEGATLAEAITAAKKLVDELIG